MNGHEGCNWTWQCGESDLRRKARKVRLQMGLGTCCGQRSVERDQASVASGDKR